MRVATIALSGALLLLPAAPAAFAQAGLSAAAGLTVSLSAQTEKKAKPKKAKAAKQEKVEYMKSAAPPEPKK